MRFEVGDRVKLKANVAASLSKPKGARRTNWVERRGTVNHYSAPTDIVVVQWDDRKTEDHWPSRALEKIDGNEYSDKLGSWETGPWGKRIS